ncbi:MAG TPA: hypothetical protein PLL18_09325, partial [Flavobacteriales bacterium]|nr:hypothetical protein [Flavobacteriales bacterium]
MEELLGQAEVEELSEAVEKLKESFEGLVAAEKAEAEAKAAEEAQEAEAASEVVAQEQEERIGPPPA